MHRWGTYGIITLLSLAALLGYIVGCSKEAAFLADDLGTGERLRSDTLAATASDWDNLGHTKGSPWNSKRVVLGAWKGYLARGFMRFSSLPDSTADITSASLFLYAARVEGDVLGNSFAIHALTDTLDQTDIFWDNMPGFSEDLLVGFDPPIESRDSVAVDVTDIVSSWVSKETDNLGMVIRLDEDLSGSDVIIELASREVPTKEEVSEEDTTIIDLRPTLRIAYLDTAEEQRFLEAVASVDVFADTLLVPFAPDPLSILVGNGSPTRGFVKFNVAAIPKEATVTKAVLRLTPNLEASSFDSIEVLCHALPDSAWYGFDTPIGISGTGLRTLVRRRLSAGEEVNLVITPLIQPLVSRQEQDRGFVIKSVSETSDLDFIKFFSHRADDGEGRPSLVVDYLVPPLPPYTEEQ
jgi:hypothetical protein